MMEENKYYVPEIEEFYQGFEYYIFSEGFDLQLPFIFEPHQLDIHFDMRIDSNSWKEYFVPNNDTFKVMVKYLDKKDIEADGWKFLGSSKDGRVATYKNGDLWLHKYDKFYSIYTILNEGGSINYSYKDESGLLPEGKPQFKFRGTIKNLSELRRILKMINI